MDVLIAYSTVVCSSLLVCYLTRDQLWNYAVSSITDRARRQISHELHQPHVISMASRGLNGAVERHVLDNPAVIRKTAELFKVLFEQEKMKKLATDLMGKALDQPAVKAVMAKYVGACVDKRMDEMLRKDRLSQVLVSMRERKAD